MKARVSRASASKRTGVRGPRRRRPEGDGPGSGDISLLDMSLADASGVRELQDKLGTSGRRGRPRLDDSLHEFVDPSLVVRMQNEAEREDMEPPAKRRSTTNADDEAVSLFDMPTPPSEPVPEDGSLFGRVKRRLRKTRSR